MRETEVANRFVYSKLAASAPLADLVGDRIFSDLPSHSPFPYVIYSRRGGDDFRFMMDIPEARVKIEPVFQVNATTQGEDKQAAYEIANLIDTALEGAADTITLDGIQYNIQGCWRVNDIDYTSVEDGIRYNYIGGYYRMFISRGV